MPGAPDTRIVSPKEPRTESAEGVVQLEWEPSAAENGLIYELQQGADATFADARTRYLGPDRASVLSGFPEGTAHFRVRTIAAGDVAGAWSEPVAVEVAYMPRRQVLALLAAGAVVFIATIGTLLAGHFRKSPAA